MSHITIRRATRADASSLILLITALAEFEKLPVPDAAAQARLAEDGFGPKPRFEAWLAFVSEHADPVGYAVTFDTYSSFLARPTLYLEDIFVLPEFRGAGAGKALLGHCLSLASERGCGRAEWVCLDWNKPAQCFYEGIGARRMIEWLPYRMTAEQIDEFLSIK